MFLELFYFFQLAIGQRFMVVRMTAKESTAGVEGNGGVHAHTHQ